MNKIGIILLNMGGPDSLESVREFLFNLFSDRDIIRLGPPFLQRPIAHFISKKRSPKSMKYYEKIGGKSPITEITINQAQAICNKFSEKDINVVCAVGMRYFHPRTPDVVRELKKGGIDKILAVSLYPHYSMATSGTSIKDFHLACQKEKIECSVVDRFFNYDGYIDSLFDVLEKGLSLMNHSLKSFKDDKNAVLLYSAHNLPKYMIDGGDPYLNELKETIRLLENKSGINGILCFQSKSGPVEWLSPTTEDKLIELAQNGIKKILILPISFVSDHVETLYEIDIAYKELMKEKGVDLYRTPSLNTNERFIDALFNLTRDKLEKLAWLK